MRVALSMVRGAEVVYPQRMRCASLAEVLAGMRPDGAVAPEPGSMIEDELRSLGVLRRHSTADVGARNDPHTGSVVLDQAEDACMLALAFSPDGLTEHGLLLATGLVRAVLGVALERLEQVGRVMRADDCGMSVWRVKPVERAPDEAYRQVRSSNAKRPRGRQGKYLDLTEHGRRAMLHEGMRVRVRAALEARGQPMCREDLVRSIGEAERSSVRRMVSIMLAEGELAYQEEWRER